MEAAASGSCASGWRRCGRCGRRRRRPTTATVARSRRRGPGRSRSRTPSRLDRRQPGGRDRPGGRYGDALAAQPARRPRGEGRRLGGRSPARPGGRGRPSPTTGRAGEQDVEYLLAAGVDQVLLHAPVRRARTRWRPPPTPRRPSPSGTREAGGGAGAVRGGPGRPPGDHRPGRPPDRPGLLRRGSATRSGPPSTTSSRSARPASPAWMTSPATRAWRCSPTTTTTRTGRRSGGSAPTASRPS